MQHIEPASGMLSFHICTLLMCVMLWTRFNVYLQAAILWCFISIKWQSTVAYILCEWE